MSIDRTMMVGGRPDSLAFLFRLGGSRRGDALRIDPAGTMIAEGAAGVGAGSIGVRVGLEHGHWYAEAVGIAVQGRSLRTALQDGDRVVVAGNELAFRVVD